MANFLIRNLEEDTHRKLREMARQHGESFEAFVRAVLRRAVTQHTFDDRPFGTSLSRRFKNDGLAREEEIEEFKGQNICAVDFD